MPYAKLSAEMACELLAKAGVVLEPAGVRVEARDERWLVRLPAERVAWFAASDQGLERLETERRVLRLLAERCHFGTPRVLFAQPEFDVRQMIAGGADPWQVYAEVRDRPEIARRIGTSVGELLAEQHCGIGFGDVGDWLPRRPAWPESREWVRQSLPAVVDDRELWARADAVMAAYEAHLASDADSVLVHTDVGLHNLAIDPGTRAVRGLFDYDGAAWADRHHDFRYLVFDWDRQDMLEAALTAYEPVAGYRIDRRRVLLYNAACAVGFLGFRAGRQPEERWCGRTLDEDLRWSRLAIARALE